MEKTNRPEYHSIVSSNLAAVAYVGSTATLYVRFNNGAEYRYEAVPEAIYTGLLEAPSAGKYFNEAVKAAGFSYVKVPNVMGDG